MDAKIWYWIILVIWIIFGAGDMFSDDPRWRRGGNLVLLILFVLLGFITSGGPVK